jgi:hypothetical protein
MGYYIVADLTSVLLTLLAIEPKILANYYKYFNRNNPKKGSST